MKSSEIRGPYLGMKPPEDLPELFAPGIVSSIFWEHSGAVFSPDGQRLYYFSSEGEENENAWVIDKTEDGWGEPRLLRISDGDNEGIKVNEIHEARSGNLYFDSTIDVKSGQTNFRTQARDPNISSVQTLKYLLVN